MMLDDCQACDLPVLELVGQVQILDSFYLSEDGSPPPDSAGWWHTFCLLASDVGPAWYEARLGNFVKVRAYQPIAELEAWSIVAHPRTKEAVAFGRRGQLISLSRLAKGRQTSVPGGKICSILEEEFNLELAEEGTISEIQNALTTEGTYPLPKLIQALGIAERISHPEAVEKGVFRFDRKLRRFWSRHAICARAEYGVFLPDELTPFLGSRP